MKTLQKDEFQEVLNKFEVEELEERMEFMTWSASATCTTANGGSCSGTVGVTF